VTNEVFEIPFGEPGFVAGDERGGYRRTGLGVRVELGSLAL
jgi:hypothetical protein